MNRKKVDCACAVTSYCIYQNASTTFMISGRFPAINGLVQRINFRKRRDAIILGTVIGICLFLLMLLLFRQFISSAWDGLFNWLVTKFFYNDLTKKSCSVFWREVGGFSGIFVRIILLFVSGAKCEKCKMYQNILHYLRFKDSLIYSS